MYKPLTMTCKAVIEKIQKAFESNTSKTLHFCLSYDASDEPEYGELKKIVTNSTDIESAPDIKSGYYIVRNSDSTKSCNTFFHINKNDDTNIVVSIPAGTTLNLSTFFGLLPKSNESYIQWNGESSEKDTSNTFEHVYENAFDGNIIISGYNIYKGQSSNPSSLNDTIKEIHFKGLNIFERGTNGFDGLNSLERISGNITLSNIFKSNGFARMFCNTSNLKSLKNFIIKMHDYEPDSFKSFSMMFYCSNVDNEIINQMNIEGLDYSDITNYQFCFYNTNVDDYSTLKIMGKNASNIKSAFFYAKINKLVGGYFDKVTRGQNAFIGCPISEVDADFGLPSLLGGNGMFEDVPLDVSHIVQIYNSLPPVPEGIEVPKTDNRNNDVDYHISFGYKSSQTQEIIDALGLVDEDGNPRTSLPMTSSADYAKSRNGWRVGFCV